MITAIKKITSLKGWCGKLKRANLEYLAHLREETMFVYLIDRLKIIWAQCVVSVEASCELVSAATPIYSHRDR